MRSWRPSGAPPKACFGKYVISHTELASDIVGLRVLQACFGIADALPVVPLFETDADLKNAAAMMRTVWASEAYVWACGTEHQCMIGYSDSAKDAGLLCAA